MVITVPETITITAAQPGIFSINQQGTGQGAVLDARTPPRLVDGAAPARVGDVVQVFCTGLGASQPRVRSGDAAPAEPLARVVTPVEARIGGRPATVHFAGLAPGFVGLYQVNVQIPEGVEPGPAVPLVILQNGAEQHRHHCGAVSHFKTSNDLAQVQPWRLSASSRRSSDPSDAPTPQR